MIPTSVIRKNLDSVRVRIAAAAHRAGRPPESVRLVAVTKTVGTDEVRALYDLGVRDFGENRVQEALRKVEACRDLSADWHLIGRLQTNKINKALGPFRLIHSLDSLHLAEALDRRAGIRRAPSDGAPAPVDVLLEVNVSGEASKGGFAPEQLRPALRALAPLRGLRVLGLMTMAPLVEDPEQTRPVFRQLRHLRDTLGPDSPPNVALRHLSMGMTQDFEVAIEEGADLIRVGTALFCET